VELLVNLLDFSLAQFICAVLSHSSDQVGVGVTTICEHPFEFKVENGRHGGLDPLHWHGGWFSLLILLVVVFIILFLVRVQVSPDLSCVLKISLGALSDKAELYHNLGSSNLRNLRVFVNIE
jgi:mannose/fructose/N-acetylgalactosamine-specific phosphotransferase system component IIC